MTLSGFIVGTAFDVFVGALLLAVAITAYRIVRCRKEGWRFHLNDLPKWFKRYAIFSLAIAASGLYSRYFYAMMEERLEIASLDLIMMILDIYGTVCLACLIFLVAGFMSYSKPHYSGTSSCAGLR